MSVLVQRTATPAEIAAELEQPINNVTYHISVLMKLGCIELVKVGQAGGGRVAQHFYRATETVYLDADAWEQLGSREKLDVVTAIMRMIGDDVADAMSRGTFYDPDDNHLSRTPMNVDLDGWDEVVSLLDETAERLMAIQERVADRTKGTKIETMPIKVEMIQFRSPSPR